MFKRIVVAVDTSDTGQRALEAAINLASECRARLLIVHAVDVASASLGLEFPAMADISEALIRNGQTLLQRSEKVAAVAGVTVETKLITIGTLDQRVQEAIAETAETWSADLIVIGTHGRHGLNRLFLGSIAEGVARVATRPVLLIRGT